VVILVSSDEINRRLEARRRGVKYKERDKRKTGEIEFSENKECSSCKTQNPSTAKFCVGCGERLETPQPQREPEKEFSPIIKGPDEPIEKPIQRKHKITQRPDDFGKPRILKPIVPPEAEIKPDSEPEPQPGTTPEPETTSNAELTPQPGTTPEPTPESQTQTIPEQSPSQEPATETQEPPQVKRPKTIPTPQPKADTTPTSKQVAEPETNTSQAKSDVDPVERIKKAKELLDLGAITPEEFDKIKNKYLNEI